MTRRNTLPEYGSAPPPEIPVRTRKNVIETLGQWPRLCTLPKDEMLIVRTAKEVFYVQREGSLMGGRYVRIYLNGESVIAEDLLVQGRLSLYDPDKEMKWRTDPVTSFQRFPLAEMEEESGERRVQAERTEFPEQSGIRTRFKKLLNFGKTK